ncbi:MAG: alkaline phosphatase family protein [Thermotogae bacterium]|nr:alkaline phosphatase family protein [Thermotogota bacterium]
MLNKKSVEKKDRSIFWKNFIKPDFDEYCFSNIPGTVLDNFGIETDRKFPDDVFIKKENHKNVVFVFVDALGWSFIEKNNFKYLNEITENSKVSVITSQFPSTTSVHVTTTHTGLTAAESGVYEWFYYDPYVDGIMSPLINLDMKTGNYLEKEGYKKEKLYPEPVLYKKLLEKGVKSFLHQPGKYSNSAYNKMMAEYSENVGYESYIEGLFNLGDKILEADGPTYSYFYYPQVDSTCHVYGPESDITKAEIDTFFYSLKKYFIDRLEGKNTDTLLIISADHGQTTVDTENPVYINDFIPNIKDYIKTNRSGEMIIPSGSFRDFFLHVKEEKTDEFIEMIKNNTDDNYLIFKTEDMIKEGFFGKNISDNFRNKVGNVVILPAKDKSIWWYEKGKYEVWFKGMHGGLNTEEMLIPLITKIL